jgi:hypothetical protein
MRPTVGRELMREREAEILRQATRQQLIRAARGAELPGAIAETSGFQQVSLMRLWAMRYGRPAPAAK